MNRASRYLLISRRRTPTRTAHTQPQLIVYSSRFAVEPGLIHRRAHHVAVSHLHTCHPALTGPPVARRRTPSVDRNRIIAIATRHHELYIGLPPRGAAPSAPPFVIRTAPPRSSPIRTGRIHRTAPPRPRVTCGATPPQAATAGCHVASRAWGRAGRGPCRWGRRGPRCS